MREVNFSIPVQNKAAVGITTGLYDRRALDCTSTLPLINSLNHLAYLTTSSARIRDILCVDGGIERLVCILKEGRSDNSMELWKWSLAFQCTVNIGVRGSETVRSRIVEADVVPVIATMLDNYIQITDRLRQKVEEERPARIATGERVNRTGNRPRVTFSSRPNRVDAETRAFRRQAPPAPIETSADTLTFNPLPPPPMTGDMGGLLATTGNTPATGQFPLTAPPERSTFANAQSYYPRQNVGHAAGPSRQGIQPLATTLPSEGNLRPVRDADRLPSMLPFSHNGLNSQPESPTTPFGLGPTQVRSSSNIRETARSGRVRRPSIRHQPSTANDGEDANGDSMVSDESGEPEVVDTGVEAEAPMVDLQDVIMNDAEGIADIASLGEQGEVEISVSTAPDPAVNENPFDVEMNLEQQPDANGDDALSVGTAMQVQADNVVLPAPADAAGVRLNAVGVPILIPRHMDASPVIRGCPRDDDVLMALQLLAYVSKYCTLRKYFQATHLVPKLKVGKEMTFLEADSDACEDCEPDEEELEEEYLQPDDFNIFPLIEKFTMRHHTAEMQYWAGVVMRNLCRKDDSKGGIRQCAYWKCGKWEEYTRQFAKCRRCRRTKYCSKECQKSAWVYHRHWCVAASTT